MRKILYLDHPQVDLNSYNIYKGLCEVLGEDNIIDFPHKRVYRALPDGFDGEYLNQLRAEVIQNKNLPYGIPPFQPNEDLIGGWPNVQLRSGHYIDPKSKLPGHYPLIGLSTQSREYTENDIGNMLRRNEISLIILSTSHRVPTIILARLRDSLGGLNKLPPIVYTDQGERDELNEHWAHVFNPAIIFKCLLTEVVRSNLKKKYGWNVYPLPNSNFLLGQDLGKHFRCFSSRYSGASQELDVYYQFMGKDNREAVIEVMEEYCNKYDKKTYPETGSYDFYVEILAQSKIVVTHRGICRETLRYWDISLAPSLMLCDGTMGCIHPNPFEDGKNAVFYSDDPSTLKEELTDKCNYYLNNNTERDKIARAGMQHLRIYHSNRARVEWMLSIIKQNGIELK